MTVVIAHLSDIHIRKSSDSILGRASAIAAAIAAASEANSECIIVCTGDVAFSGSVAEYDLAKQFFDSIVKSIEETGRSIRLLFVPGNHDCDFSTSDKIRSAVIESVRKDPRQVDDAGIHKHCLEAQKNFFAFMKDVSQVPDEALDAPAMIWTHRFGRVKFRMLNSAWMSSISEGSASLVFPVELLEGAPDEFTVTCLHHPPHWFTQGTRRALWRAIAMGSDLILTGHEHEANQSLIESRSDATIHSHFEGGVLQESGQPEVSTFSVYVADLDARTYRPYEFRWKHSSKQYITNATAQSPRPREEPLPLNRIRSLSQFQFADTHREFLDALTMNITHSVVGDLRLRDVFVYPDLYSANASGDGRGYKERTVRGAEVLPFVEASSLLIFTGEKYAGRTALAKTLCVDLLERGFVPVYLRISRRLRSTKAWIEAIEKAFCEQYSSELLNRYQQLTAPSRVVIVDDVDLCCAAAEPFTSQMEELVRYAGHLIISADTAAFSVKALVRLAEAGVPHFQIRPFGYLQRDRLVEKWLLLGGDQIDGKALVRRLHETTKTINSIVGKGFVPSYPFFVLALLQAGESAVQLEAKTSAHGYYFEQLIKTELLRGKQEHAQLDVTLGVLSFIAYEFFATKASKMSDFELRQTIQRYEAEYALKLDFAQMLAHLVERRMLSKAADGFAFAYDYVYYFFVARYIARNIHRDDIKSAVTELSRLSSSRRSGDILLFLAHFSSDPFVIAQMLAGANAAFEEQQPIDLRNDVSLVGEVNRLVDACAYEESGDALVTRRAVMHAQDRAAETSGEHARAEDEGSLQNGEEIALINRLLAALRNMEVVGQVLKSNPGHLDAKMKLQLATAAYGVGARIWHWFLRLMAEEQKDLVEHLVAHLRAEQPSLTPEELREEVSSRLVSLLHLVSFSMVKRIALSIGAPALETTYRTLVKEVGGDAPTLVLNSIMLDCFSSSPEGELAVAYRDVKKNPVSAWILRQLVWEHLHLFQLEPSEKQKLCAAVEMPYKAGLGVGQWTKKLPEGSE